jgi:hypothetical protein
MRWWLAGMLWCLGAQEAAAQVAIPDQPDAAAWYAEATTALRARAPAAATLPTLAPGPVAPSLAKDLSAFDWVEAGTYSFADRAATLTGDAPCQIPVHRYEANGAELQFAYVAPCDARTAGQIVHTNFQNPPPTTTSVSTTKAGVWLKSVTYGEAASNRVVSYADGVLVIDIPSDGKPSSKPAFRTVYLAMPRRFQWAFGQ